MIPDSNILNMTEMGSDTALITRQPNLGQILQAAQYAAERMR